LKLDNAELRRKVLMIAFHFPPFRGSSGMQRTLRFAQHLPRFGWQPIVLSISPVAYDNKTYGPGNEIPGHVEVHRAFGLDAARHLSLFGKYFRRLALPDRWSTWRYWAIPKALELIERCKPDALWTTFPIATAHEIGCELVRRRNVPWVAEFRDPMWTPSYPADPELNSAWRHLENRVLEQARRVVVVTPGAMRQYAERLAGNSSKVVLIENGFDEESFARASTREAADPAKNKKVVIVHSGKIYRNERDPTHLFSAIQRLHAAGTLTAETFLLVLRDSGDEENLRRSIAEKGLQALVRLEPNIDYVSALQEMMQADGLLILQAANCNEQIPAKLYEYLRAGRPVLALTDPAGDTAGAVRRLQAGFVARLDSAMDIESALSEFLRVIRCQEWQKPSDELVTSFSREAQTAHFVRTLEAALA
jgi:glycosyltransferase involved in cell wall biosynthesis